MFLYIVKNKVNNKRYVGKTVIGVEHRWKKHLIDSFNEKLCAYNFIFHRAIRKYGVENFEFEHIFSSELSNDVITESDLNKYEKYFINLYRTFIGFQDCKGYNMTLGGEGWCGRGNKQIDVYDKNLNFITTYPSIEEAARQLNLQATNISAVVNKRVKSAGNYIFCESGGEPTIFENKVNIKIDVYDLKRNFIKTFDTMRQAAKFTEVTPGTVFNCCNSKITKCKNYICLYHGDDINNHRRSKINKRVDLYNVKSKKFIKTFNSMTELMVELNINRSVVQRCLNTNNHLAGDYLIFPHNEKLSNDDIV